MTTRRKFIAQTITGAAAITALPVIDVIAKNSAIQPEPSEVPLLTFALISDLHYGQPNTADKTDLNNMIGWLNEAHDTSKHKHNFIVVNGDIVHDRPELLKEVKTNYLDKLKSPFYAIPGNHDHADTALWKSVFGHEDNFVIEKHDIGLIFANTSNLKGEIIGPDNGFLKRSLDDYAGKKLVLVIMHVPPGVTENSSFDSPETINLLNSYPNVKAIFSGHDHKQDGQKMFGNIPCFFDSHVGGNWGTNYRGYRVVSVGMDYSVSTHQINPAKNPVLNSERIKLAE